MAVTVADLMKPEGPVEEPLFPGEGNGLDGSKLYLRLASYLAQAVTKTTGIAFPDPDLAVKTWALYLTFKAAYILAIARPSDENTQVEVLGSHGFDKDQRDGLLALANEYLAQYETLELEVPNDNQTQIGIPSRVVPLLFEY